MKFVIRQFVLAHVLSKAGTVLPSRDVLPVLKNFLVRADAEAGVLEVVATDMSLSLIAVTSAVDVIEGGTAAFPAKAMLGLVAETAADSDVEVTVADGVATVRVGRAEWSLRLEDASEYPEFPGVTGSEVQVSRKALLEALTSVRYAASRDSLRSNLMMVDVKDNAVRASDGLRFHQVTASADLPDCSIPILAVDDLVRLLAESQEETVGMGVAEDSLVFVVDQDVFVARRLVAEFPDIDAQLLTPALANDERLVVPRKELASAVRRVRVTADEDTSAVVIDLDGGTAVVSARDKTGSHAREELDVEWADGKRRVVVNHEHLLALLGSSDDSGVSLYFGPDAKHRPSLVVSRTDSSIGVLAQLRADIVG